jgi:hypothetical protein
MQTSRTYTRPSRPAHCQRLIRRRRIEPLAWSAVARRLRHGVSSHRNPRNLAGTCAGETHAGDAIAGVAPFAAIRRGDNQSQDPSVHVSHCGKATQEEVVHQSARTWAVNSRKYQVSLLRTKSSGSLQLGGPGFGGEAPSVMHRHQPTSEAARASPSSTSRKSLPAVTASAFISAAH